MDRAEYEFLVQRLQSERDIDSLHKKAGYSKDLLYNLLAKKIVRNTLKKYYPIQHKLDYYYRRWLRGESIVKIARELEFSPILLASFLLIKKKGFTRKQFNDALRNPDLISDSRVKKEIKECLKEDFVYSPWAYDIQKKNGEEGERKLAEWLDKRKIPYLTEKDNKAINHHRKTPDFLFEKPHNINGFKANWIESKAMFGDDREVRRQFKKQLEPYLRYFGPGIVVYWYGFIDDISLGEKIKIVDGSFFKD
jgi:hypothetical protein